MSYDIVIIHGVKDSDTLPYCIEYIKKNVSMFRNIYIISQDTNHSVFLHPVFKDCIIHSEKDGFLFTIDDVNKYIQTPNRNGWYLQQLLKLYASFSIKDMLDDYVVIDSDTIFLQPVFFKMNNPDSESGNKYLFNLATENHIPYFEHMNRLKDGFKKIINASGIAHHMIFNRNIILELFNYCDSNLSTFWIKFLECVDPSQRPHSGASEYEIYFNYMLKFHKDKVLPRKIKFENIGEYPEQAIKKYSNTNIGYISLHAWMRPQKPQQNIYDVPPYNFNFGLTNLSKNDIIGGEVFQSLCDATIITRDIHNFHKSLPSSVCKIFIDPLSENDKNIIKSRKFNSFFVYTHILDKFINEILPLINYPFTLMTHNSDHPINEQYLPLLEDERLYHMYSQNTFITHPKLTSLPIGIANSQWQHGNKDVISLVTKQLTPTPFLKKIDKIYVNFSIGTYREHRQKVYDILKKKDFSFFDTQKSFYDLWPSMSSYKWISCPRGNGIDTHRLWETLYAGCIPVIDRSVNSESFKDFPMIFVDNWEDLTLEFLQTKTKEIVQNFLNRKYDFRSLSINYWRDIKYRPQGPDYNNIEKINLSSEDPRSSIEKIDGAFILAYIGNLPHFTEDCIKQIRLWNQNEKIYLCCSKKDENIELCEMLKEKYNIIIEWIENLVLTEEHIDFNRTYTNMSMNGFWKYTTERFFIVEECMRKYNIENIIHLEMDNLIYFNLTSLLDKFKSLNSLAIPSDCEKRFIAGVCFINTSDELRKLNKFFSLNSSNRAEMEVILHYNKYNNNRIKILPVLPKEYCLPLQPDQGQATYDKMKFSNYIDELGGIFDAAAIGQYMFGIDPIHKKTNTDGFINESTCFKINKQYLRWEKNENKLWRLNISADNKNWYPLYNIHVHNKNLKRGISDRKEMEKHLPNIL
jgi:hypothetical protein